MPSLVPGLPFDTLPISPHLDNSTASVLDHLDDLASTILDCPLPVEHPSLIPQSIPLRRSTRPVSKPTWLTDFVSTVITNNFVVSSSLTLSPSHCSYLFNVSIVHKPSTYLQASTDAHWIDAIQQELEALKINET